MWYTKISLTELFDVSVVNATKIPQCARAHYCIGYHWLSVNENLCLIDGVEKVVGWSPLRWNDGTGIVSVLISIPPITPTFSFIINSFDKSMLEDGSMFGIRRIWLEILTVCWESARSELITWGSPSRFINQPRSSRQRLRPHHEGAARQGSN